MSREKFLCYNKEERSNKDVMSRLFGLQGMRKWPQSLKAKLVSIFIDFSENRKEPLKTLVANGRK